MIYDLRKLISPILIVIFAVVMRLLPHPANVAPIGAMALFGGVYLDKKYALVVPLIALFLSDIFLGFYSTMVYVYGSFLLIGVIGIYLSRHKSFKNIVLGSLFSSILFFLITNFGVWFATGLYPKNFSGLMESYFFALPFFRNTLIGDFLYTGLFFGSYELVLKFVGKPSFAKK